MTRPGDRLRSIAARVCGTAAMERLIDPVIADLQHEHAAAVRQGRVWRSRWIRLAGYAAFSKVACLGAALSVDRRLGRAVAIALSTGTIITALLIWVVLGNVPPTIDYSGKTLWLILYLVPQGLAISVPVCLALGVFCRLHGQKATGAARRTVLALALGCSLATFANVGWITPAANRAYRTFLIGRSAVRGANELPIGELRRRANEWVPEVLPGEALPVAFWYHARLALSASPLVLGLFVTSANRRLGSGPILLVITTLTIFVGCFCLFHPSQVAELTRWLPAFAIAWIPNLIVALGTLVTVLLPRSARLTRPMASGG